MKMKKMFLALCLSAGLCPGGIIGVYGQENPAMPDGPWSGKVETGSLAMNLTFNFENSGDGLACTLDSPDQGIKGIEAIVEAYMEDSVRVQMPSISASYGGRITRDTNGMPERIEGVFSQAGMSLPLDLEPGTPVRYRPQTPAPPYPYVTEEVTFRNGDVELSGTLTWPEGYDGKNGTGITAVLMVSGSGQQNRDEEIFGHKPFAVIADWLARHGIASLRYDDRGVGKSSGNPETIDIMSNMEDALAGLGYLESLGKFRKTGVLGHSEGGTIAFMIGGTGKADFIISLAGAAVSGRQILVEQNGRFLELSGIPDTVTASYCSILDKLLEYRIACKDDRDSDVADSIIANAGAVIPAYMADNLKSVYDTENRWIDSFITLDPREYIEVTECPVFAANGSLDCQVIAESNLGTLRELLGNRPEDFIREYGGLNHLFQHCKTGNPTEYPEITETFATEVLSDITGWLLSLPEE